MKILKTEEYCSICKKRLKLGNIGAIVKDKSAQNACQEPCANTFILQQRKPVVIDPKPKLNMGVATGANDFVLGIERLQRQMRQEPTTTRIEAQPPEHPTAFDIEELGNTVIIKATNDFGVELPHEIFYEVMLRETNIVKFAILKIEVWNMINIPIRTTMKRDNTNNRVFTSFLCNSYSMYECEFSRPLFINNNNLIIEFKNAGNAGNLSVYENVLFTYSSKLTIEVLERGE